MPIDDCFQDETSSMDEAACISVEDSRDEVSVNSLQGSIEDLDTFRGDGGAGGGPCLRRPFMPTPFGHALSKTTSARTLPSASLLQSFPSLPVTLQTYKRY